MGKRSSRPGGWAPASRQGRPGGPWACPHPAVGVLPDEVRDDRRRDDAEQRDAGDHEDHGDRTTRDGHRVLVAITDTGYPHHRPPQRARRGPSDPNLANVISGFAGLAAEADRHCTECLLAGLVEVRVSEGADYRLGEPSPACFNVMGPGFQGAPQ